MQKIQPNGNPPPEISHYLYLTMEKRDFIVDEIRKFGQMVLGLIGKLQQSRLAQQYDFNLSMADLEFESEAGFTLKMMIEMEPGSLEAFIDAHHELNSENTELLADLLIEISEDPGIDTRQALARAKELLEFVDRRERTYALERAGKMDFIEAKLNG